MSNGKEINAYRIITNKVKLGSVIRNKWEELLMKPNEKTYYIFESLYRLIKTNKESHIFVLESLIELNSKAEYQNDEDRNLTLETLNKALKEITE